MKFRSWETIVHRGSQPLEVGLRHQSFLTSGYWSSSTAATKSGFAAESARLHLPAAAEGTDEAIASAAQPILAIPSQSVPLP